MLLLAAFLLAPGTRISAEDIVQIKPFVTHVGVSEEDELCMEVQIVNDTYDYIGNLQYDLLLPKGIEYFDIDFNDERVPYTQRRGQKNWGFSLFDHTPQTTGYERYLYIPQALNRELRPITGKSGTFMYLYYTLGADMKPGVYPVSIQGTVLSKTEIVDMHPGPSSSYVVVKESADAPNPLETEKDIDLSGMTNYIPTFVVDSLNAALARNENIRSLNLSGATSFGKEPEVPENVVFRAAKTGGLKRSFRAGKKATVCLPFAVSAEKMAELGLFYQFEGLKAGTADVVVMKEVTGGLSANIPYIFEPSTDISGIGFSGDTTCVVATAGSQGDAFLFQGTYDYKKWVDGDSELGSAYGFAAVDTTLKDGTKFETGEFVRLGAGAEINPFRAYLKYGGNLSDVDKALAKGCLKSLPNRLRIEWISADGEITGIDGMQDKGNDATSRSWYTIDGKRLNGKPGRKGIYVHGGKKRIVAD